jgi:8-oxo-dGTP pyrophosphatase MutT (NUDIX family)
VPEHVVAAVPYRESADGPAFLLVRTKRGRWWTFPKGHVDDNDASPAAAALREAREEGGAIGTVVSDVPFARYHYVKEGGAEQDVDAYLMKVRRTAAPSEPARTPTWCSPAEARIHLAEGANAREHRRVLAAALRRLTPSRRRPA